MGKNCYKNVYKFGLASLRVAVVTTVGTKQMHDFILSSISCHFYVMFTIKMIKNKFY